MKKRVYVLDYGIHVNMYSLTEPNIEKRTEYYSREERDKFMSRYFELKDKYYVENLVSYFAELDEVNVEAMAKQI